MKVKLIILVLLVFSLQSCSLVVSIAFFNNTKTSLDICNLHKAEQNCYKVASEALIKIPLIASVQIEQWEFSINKKVYGFKFGVYPEHASNIYCTGIIQKRCDIPLQFESNELLYWAGKESRLPAKSFGAQPLGFPVKPNT